MDAAPNRFRIGFIDSFSPPPGVDSDIVRLLVWQFSRPVILANIIAWPIAWWMMRDWLNGFDQRIPLTPIPFLVAAAIALGIAVATVVGHAVKVARANPIHALRYE